MADKNSKLRLLKAKLNSQSSLGTGPGTGPAPVDHLPYAAPVVMVSNARPVHAVSKENQLTPQHFQGVTVREPVLSPPRARAFSVAAVLPSSGALPKFASVVVSGKTPSLAIRRPDSHLPPKTFELDCVVEADSFTDFARFARQEIPAAGGELTIVVPFLENQLRTCRLVGSLCEQLMAILYTDFKHAKITFSATKAGAETELLADSLVSADFDVNIRVREHAVVGFFAENLSSTVLPRDLGEACRVVEEAAGKNFQVGRYLSGGKPKVEQRHHGLISFTCEEVVGNIYQKTKIHVLHLSRAAVMKRPAAAPAVRDDKTLKAVHKLVDFLADEKLMAIGGRRPVAGWRDSKLTRLCQAGLGGGGVGIFLLDLIEITDYNELGTLMEFAAKIRTCRNCSLAVDERNYRRPLRRPATSALPQDSVEAWERDREEAAWDWFNAETRSLMRC